MISICNFLSNLKQITDLKTLALNSQTKAFLGNLLKACIILLSVNQKEDIVFHLSLNYAQLKILLLLNSQLVITLEILYQSLLQIKLILSMICLELMCSTLTLNSLILSIMEITIRLKFLHSLILLRILTS